MVDLTLRAKKILNAIVAEYLQTGEAVGSRTVTRRHEINLSPATVRNVMSDLADMGLLGQPHTSAGRVPTEAGLRFFVDSLLKVRSLSAREKEQIRERCEGDARDFEEVMQRISKMLSDITRHAGIVLTPLADRQTFEHIEFVPLKSGQALGILVTTGGRIENKLLDLDFPIAPARLERIHNYLDSLLKGLSLDEVRARVVQEMSKEKNQYDDLAAEALRLGYALVAERPPEVIVSGGGNLVDASHTQDPQELARMRSLLLALEDKEILVHLLDKTMKGEGMQVFLGADTAATALGDSSVVAVPYGPEELPLGAIAVIGPRRMNYGKVISIVDYTADLVTRMIGGS
jgi:heat-inducible transcriptional repressor